jgi:signal transduction histidine kinase
VKTPRARLAFGLVLAALLAALALNAVVVARDRAAPGEKEVDRDVEPARARLASELTAMERTCADVAALALARTADVVDRPKLFAALADLGLPPGAGLFLEDGGGRVLAWTGATVDDDAFAAMPRTSDGAWFVSTPASKRLAVRRTRATPRALEGAPFLAVCHVPVSETFPPRNRALTPSSLERDAAREFRVDEDVRVLPPDAAGGDPVPSVFGGTLARLDVRPVSAESWNASVGAAGARRRAAIVALLVLVAAAALWRETSATGAARAAHLVRAGLVVAARIVLGFLPLSSAADFGPLTDETKYSHALPLDLAGSPLSLALTCAAACLAAASLRRAAQAGAPRAGPAWRTLAASSAAALACRWALSRLVADVVENSTVEFLAPDTILPRAAPALLLASLLGAAVAAVLVVDAAWAWFPPAEKLSPARGLVASMLLASALAPLVPDAPHAVALAIVAVTGFAAALAACTHGGGTVVRAALIPLGAAVALVAPLEGELHRATQKAVERTSRTVSDDSLYVANTLESAARSETLAAALRARSAPEDLALELWRDSPLAGRPGGSSLEIAPADGFGETRTFRIDLPPDEWLPDPDRSTAGGRNPSAPLQGRGSGAEGRWIVGRRTVDVGGTRAATLRVALESRPPAASLPELQVLGTSRPDDGRAVPTLVSTRYARDGRLLESDDPYRPAGVPLDPELRRLAVDERRDVWRTSAQPDAELEVFVRPEVEDGEVTGVRAFSYDTGGARTLLLSGTRAALCGAIVSLAALLLTARSWARSARLRIAQKLVISYAIVAALPLTLLGWANRELGEQRADASTRRDLAEAISLVLEDAALVDLADLPPRPGPVRDISRVAYAKGRHVNVFLGPLLVAASNPGLFDAELLPRRLPGDVYREVVLSEQPFEKTEAAVGGYSFDVGYEPWRNAEGRVIGAVSVPLLNQRRLRDRELASAETAVLGLYLASLVAAVAAGTFLAGRLTKPLSDLTEAAQRVARGDVEQPVPVAGPDELGEVVAAFNQMQRDLGESRAKLVRAEKEAAWRDMARQVAHEVKNPLTPMRLAAEHLRRAWRDKVPQFDDVLERGVDLIVRQTESLQRIATAFSDFARFPNRRREPVDLPSLLDEVLDLWRGTPGLEIRREVARPLPPLSADPDELRRVLVNLSKNAVEAIDGRAGTLTATLARADGFLVLTFADDGPGIPDEVLARLFEPYLSTKTKGTGLGLAICRRAIEDLGGTIAVESRAGAGTKVTVRLPVSADG